MSKDVLAVLIFLLASSLTTCDILSGETVADARLSGTWVGRVTYEYSDSLVYDDTFTYPDGRVVISQLYSDGIFSAVYRLNLSEVDGTIAGTLEFNVISHPSDSSVEIRPDTTFIQQVYGVFGLYGYDYHAEGNWIGEDTLTLALRSKETLEHGDTGEPIPVFSTGVSLRLDGDSLISVHPIYIYHEPDRLKLGKSLGAGWGSRGDWY